MKSERAIVIGSGIGGIAVSIRLALLGFDVHVYEANSTPGGKLSFFEKAGYQFDEGPSLFTQPHNIEELFLLAGESIHDYFSYRPVDIACTYFYENGKVIHAYTDKNKFSDELHLKLNEKKDAAKTYLSNSEKLYHSVGTIFLNFSLHKIQTWLHKRIFRAFVSVKFSYLFSTLYKHNKTSFQSKEAVQLFCRFATYNGSNPYQAPGMLSLIPHLEHNEGTYYPEGGMIQIIRALHQLATKKGVTFHFNHPVEKILQENKKVKGIITKGKEIHSSLVVSNGDVYYTYKNLLEHQAKAFKLEKQERSSSALIFYWGIKNSFTKLGLHNILFSERYEEEFQTIFEKDTLTDDPTIYINITSKMQPSHAPAGGENWFVMINAPVNNHQDWDERVAKTRKFVIEKINRMLQTDIETFIETESVMSPAGIEKKTNTFKGSLYGTSSNSKWAAFFRPANFTSSIKGLYFCGGTVHPGGGIPLCLKSAFIAATLIKKDYGK